MTTPIHHRLRSIAATGLLACASLTLMQLGCVSTRMRQAPATNDRPNIPHITAERLQACFTEYVSQLDSQNYGVQGKVQVNEEGRIGDVSVDGVPITAPDLAACMRVTLRDMSVPSWPMRVRTGQSTTRTNTSTLPPRDAMGTPAIIMLGATIIFTDLVIEAGGITLIFALSMELVNTVARDLADAARRVPGDEEEEDECTDGYDRCMDSPAGRERGNTRNYTRCATCLGWCKKTGSWPSSIEMSPEGPVSCY